MHIGPTIRPLKGAARLCFAPPCSLASLPRNAKINRHTKSAESCVSHSKQRTGAQINRHKNSSPTARSEILIETLPRIEMWSNSLKTKEKTFSNRNKNHSFFAVRELAAASYDGPHKFAPAGVDVAMAKVGNPFLTWLIALAATTAAALLSMAYVDRPVADYVHIHLMQSQMIQALAKGLGPLVIFVGLGLFVLVASGCWVLAGRTLSARMETPLLCSWSLVWTMAATQALKAAFGHSEPAVWTGTVPGISAHATYSFHFMSGRPLFEAFPSGTTSITAAILSVLWIRAPRLRAVYAMLLAFVAFALIVTNGHFVADVIGGAFLGASTGWMTILLWKHASGIRGSFK